MFSLAWEYLLGRLVASDPTDRQVAEWPPHPDRVYMALVASWGETGRPPRGREALEWLESLGPPELHLPVMRHLSDTAPVAYVPVNDTAYSKGKHNPLLRDLPVGRNRQPRGFPRQPIDGACWLVWPDVPPEEAQRHRAALEALCLATASIGHSSSLVRVWVPEEEPTGELVRLSPSRDECDHQLRVPSAGRLGRLIEAYAEGGEGWDRPPPGHWQAYRQVSSNGKRHPATGVFSEKLVVLRAVGKNRRLFSATHGPEMADALRKTLMSRWQGDDRILELISGHRADGAPLEEPHVAFAGLAFVGREHADAHLMGMSMILPRGLDRSREDGCLSALARCLDDECQLSLRLGEKGTLELEAVELTAEERQTLLPNTWTAAPRGARTWASVTPVVMDRMPQRREKDPDAFLESVVGDACERAGYPRPVRVAISEVSPLHGTPHARRFHPMNRKSDKARRWHSHVTVEWSDPVVGPVLLGAGRYRGMGLLRPLYN